MKVRLANESDIDVLVPLYLDFYKTTDYSRIYDCDPETIYQLTEHIVTKGAMVVYEDLNGVVMGSAGAYVGPATFNKNVTVAVEVVYYLHPDARGNQVAPALLQCLEQRCKDLGAVSLQMVRLRTSPPAVDDLYKMNGYKPSEYNFTKRLVD
mgnify:CR=1 FL=1